MSRLLLLLFALFQITSISGQSFSVSPNPASGNVDLDVNPSTMEFFAAASITNNTSETLSLKWERIVNDKPECWETSIMDLVLQSLPYVDEHEFDIAPNSDDLPLLVFALLSVNSDPTAGEAHVVLKVSNLDIPADTVIVDYFLTSTGQITCTTTGISEKEKNALNLYPNPSSDYIQLTETSAVQQLVVYNILGAPVKTFNVSASQIYNIAILPKGVYLVELINGNGEVVKTIKLLKV